MGQKLPAGDTFVHPYTPAAYTDGLISASIDILDARYGSLWTNCSRELFDELKAGYGDYIGVEITHHGRIVYGNDLKYGKSFSDVNIGATLIYINSLLNVGVAINQGNFARAHDIGAGRDWLIHFRKSVGPV